MKNEKPSYSPIDMMNFLYNPGDVFELCAMKTQYKNGKKGKPDIYSGYFKDFYRAAEAANQIDKQISPTGIYVTLNPCPEDLLSKADHQLIRCYNRTSDDQIKILQNIFIDIDPIRDSGTSATDGEQQSAIEKAELIREHVITNGWPEPLYACSGNGSHLIFRTHLHNTSENVDLIKAFLEVMKTTYSDDAVEIDTSVKNPSRLVRLYSTKTRKGEKSEMHRPHRRSYIISSPEKPVLVTKNQLMAVVTNDKQKPKAQPDKRTANRIIPDERRVLDVKAYLNFYGKQIHSTKTTGNAEILCLQECVFNPDHGPNEASIIVEDGVKLRYQCFHNSCNGRTWEQARKAISGDDKLTNFISGAINKRFTSFGSMMSGKDILDHSFPKNEMLIDNIVGERESTLICGEAGVGKSNLSLQLGLSLGSPLVNTFLGMKTQPEESTLFIQSENSAEAIQNRMRIMCNGNLALGQGCNNIYFPVTDQSSIMVTRSYLNEPGFQSFLINSIQETGAKLIIIDPLISFHNGDENDNSSMRKALDDLSNIQDKTDTSVILIHHVGKGYSDGSASYSGRGASAIGDWSCNNFLLKSKRNTNSIEVICQKARNIAKPDPFLITMGQDLSFQRVDLNNSNSNFSQHLVTDSLQQLGGQVSKQADLIKKMMAISNKSKSVVLKHINHAVQADIIEEVPNPLNAKVKGYKLP